MEKTYLLFCSKTFEHVFLSDGIKAAMRYAESSYETPMPYVWTPEGNILDLLSAYEGHNTYIVISKKEYDKIDESMLA